MKKKTVTNHFILSQRLRLNRNLTMASRRYFSATRIFMVHAPEGIQFKKSEKKTVHFTRTNQSFNFLVNFYYIQSRKNICNETLQAVKTLDRRNIRFTIRITIFTSFSSLYRQRDAKQHLTSCYFFSRRVNIGKCSTFRL